MPVSWPASTLSASATVTAHCARHCLRPAAHTCCRTADTGLLVLWTCCCRSFVARVLCVLCTLDPCWSRAAGHARGGMPAARKHFATSICRRSQQNVCAWLLVRKTFFLLCLSVPVRSAVTHFNSCFARACQSSSRRPDAKHRGMIIVGRCVDGCCTVQTQQRTAQASWAARLL